MRAILTKYRGWIIFLIVVPVSALYRGITKASRITRKALFSAAGRHDQRVQHIASDVREGFEAGQKMCTARAPWKTMSIRRATYKRDYRQIRIGLDSILELDKERGTIRVEPMVTMADITRYLNPKGYALAIQVEMDDLTVGGLCMGIGIETTSHRLGFLYETIRSYELVTAKGEVLNVTAETYPDLYHALPMSHGTLGFLTAVELEVVPIRKYMKLRYQPYYSREDFCAAFMSNVEGPNQSDFVEALAYGEGKAVLMTGELVDSVPPDGKVNSINKSWKPWFFTHVESMLDRGETVEYIPVRHYYHRHTPSMFFQLQDLIPFGNEPWYRYLFAWMGAPKVSLMKYTLTKELRKASMHNRVAQDMLVPIGDMFDAFELVDNAYEIFPMWVCPVKITEHKDYPGFIRRVEPKEADDFAMYVDIGIYGIPPSVKRGTFDAVQTGRKLEDFVRSRTGFNMLYADIFMSRDEFEQMFDHRLYREVRKRYGADKAFPEVYDKVIPEKWLIDLEEVAKKEAAGSVEAVA